MTRSVLVIAAHPDDEILGCGGTLARHARAGDRVSILILGEGATSRADAKAGDVANLRDAAERAARILGASAPRFASLSDNRLDTVALLDVVKCIEEEVAARNPAVVYTHHGGDLNIDHRIAHQAVLTACRPLPGSAVRSIYAYETPSSTEWSDVAIDSAGFRPTRFVDIGTDLDAKLAALECYASELRAFPHPRSKAAVTALAQWRGTSVGLRAAEAFVVVRDIQTL